MRDRRRQSLRSEAGQTGADFMGMLLLVALIIAAIVATGIHQQIATRTAELICRIAGDTCAESDGGVGGKPPPYMCVTNSSERGLAGAVKVFFVEIGGGVDAIKEVRADGSVKITIKGNAKAGLEFGSPGGEFEG